VRLDQTHDVDDEGLARLRLTRDDVVLERPDGPDHFLLAEGPFRTYERTLEARSSGSGRYEVRERIDFRLAPAVWPVFAPAYRHALKRPARATMPWWAPPQRIDARAATVLGLLATLTVFAGYIGTLVTQTITFAADEFGASKSAQGDTLSAVRIGVLLSLLLTAAADRRGRRGPLMLAAGVGCLATATGALAPNLVALGATQTVARGMTTALALLITITAAEEMPSGSRAYAISLLAMTGALGAGMAIWVLPLADLGERAWRVLFVLPLLALPLLRWVWRQLPETRRFVAPHASVGFVGHGRRFWLLAVSALLLAIFTSPASQFMNDYLRDERGYSAARISLFTLATNTPAALGIIVGGRLADQRGRRVVGAVAVIGGVGFTVLMFLQAGAAMWAWSIVGGILGAAFIPALGVYGPELFPTSLRGKANGVITMLGVLGSVIGLSVAGRLADRWGSFGPGLSILAIGPLLMAVLILVAYPETAHRELEELNPEDVAAVPAAPVPPVG
jgi:MFS family permease